MPEGVPANRFGDAHLASKPLKDLFPGRVCPNWHSAPELRASEDPVRISAIWSHQAPSKQLTTSEFVKRHRLPRCLGLAVFNMTVRNRTEDVRRSGHEVNVFPLEAKHLAHTQPGGCTDDTDRSLPIGEFRQ